MASFFKQYPLRPIVPGDWQRFHFYARRIKEFRVCGDHTALSAEAYTFLSLAAPCMPLCPNIRRLVLDWNQLFPGKNNQMFPYILLFLGNRTEYLELNIDGLDNANLSLLYSLPRDYPQLKVVDFSFADAEETSPTMAATNDAISSVICGWHKLEELIWWQLPISFNALTHLSTISTLKRLVISLPETDTDNWNHQIALLPQHPFSAIQDLDIVVYDFRHCGSLLSQISPCHLESLMVTLIECELPDHTARSTLVQVIQSLHRHNDHTTLTQFLIDSTCVIRLQSVDQEVLRPLLAFQNLVDVRLLAHLSYNIKYDFVRAMALAWPRLKLLYIGMSSTVWDDQPQVTLGGIVPLLMLPDLVELRIVINASGIDHDFTRPRIAKYNDRLTELDLGFSTIDDPISVATLLSDFLPNLKIITSSWKPSSSYRAWWEEVNRLVPAMTAIRKQERCRHNQKDLT